MPGGRSVTGLVKSSLPVCGILETDDRVEYSLLVCKIISDVHGSVFVQAHLGGFCFLFFVYVRGK